MNSLLSAWLYRRRVQSEILRSGRPVESRAVTNPFHAVSITPGENCCRAADALAGTRFLSAEAPTMPLYGCDAASCTCSYAHHEDRRVVKDRRLNDPWNKHQARRVRECRQNRGRRITDY